MITVERVTRVCKEFVFQGTDYIRGQTGFANSVSVESADTE